MVQIGLTPETPGWAGVRFREDQMGMAAVDMVVAQIHRGESGLPVYQKGILIEGEWEG